MTRIGYLALVLGLVVGVSALAFAQAPPSPPPAAMPAATPVREAPPAALTPSLETVVREVDDILDRAEELETNEERTAALDRVNELVAAALAQNPDSPWVFYLQGRAYAAAGRQGDAVAQMRKFVDTREGRIEWRAHRLLGDLFVEEFPQLARASYLKAEELVGDEPTVALGLSRCAQTLGRTEEAIARARRAAEGKPTPAYRARLARLLLNKRSFAEAQVEAQSALDVARKAVEKAPGQRRPLQELEAVYRLMVEIVQARQSGGTPTAGDCLEVARLMAERAEIAARLLEFDRLRVLETGVKELSATAPPQLMEEYAMSLARVGRRDAAKAEFERLLTIDPGNAVAKEWLERIRRE